MTNLSWQREALAKGKGVPGDGESEGSRIAGEKNRRAKLWSDEQKPGTGRKRWARLLNKPKPNSCTESLVVDVAGIRVKERVSTRGGLMDMGSGKKRTMVETRFAVRSQTNP